MKTIATCLLVLLFMFNTQAQDYWKFVSIQNPSSNVAINDILIQDSQNIWLGTNSGLYRFNSVSETFSHFPLFGPGITLPNIAQMRYANGLLWLTTNYGLSSFDGSSFTNYDANSGLLSNTITGMGVDALGQLWIGSHQGTSYFNGQTFVHDSLRLALKLGADGAGNIFVHTVRQTQGFQIDIYDGMSWSTHNASASQSFNFEPFQETLDGRLIAYVNATTYYELTYPFNLQLRNYPLFGTNNLTAGELDIDGNGNRWFASTEGLFTEVNGEFKIQTLFPTANVSAIAMDQNTVVVAGSQGVFVGSPSIKPSGLSRTLEVNSLSAIVNSHAPLLNDPIDAVAGLEIPKGSNLFAVYQAGLIVAAKEANTGSLYVSNQGASIPNTIMPGPVNSVSSVTRPVIVHLSRAEINLHRQFYQLPGYVMPDGIVDWPANGDTTLGEALDLAPFHDVNNNGCYDPQNGDYPAIKGDEAIYWINNDANVHISPSPTQLEFHGMLYGFHSATDKTLNQTVFLEYDIINRGSRMYDSVKVGMFVDPDIGSAFDDYIGCDSLKNIAYAYNAYDSSSASAYGSDHPAVGVRMLSDSMSNLMYFNIGQSVIGDPFLDQHWWNYLNSAWKDGSPLRFGGNGYHLSTGATNTLTKYVYSGDPVTANGWTESNTGTTANPPGDRRFLAAIPFFSLAPAQRRKVEMAIGYGIDSIAIAPIDNITEMSRVLDHAKMYWDTMQVAAVSYGSMQCPKVSVGIKEEAALVDLSVYPNPTSGILTVKVSDQLQSIQLFDIRGALLKSYEGMEQNLIHELALPTDVENGVYLLRFIARNGTILSKKVILSR